jgi:DNA-binding MarR family transcriptional regulator
MDTQAPSRPLSPTETAVVNALGRLILVLPRVLDHDLSREQRMSMTEFMTLLTIAEAPQRRLRMAELAAACYVSLSGMTRIVTRLENEGWVERVRCAEDARGAEAALTDAGLDQYQRALPTHLGSLRRHIFEPLEDTDLTAFATALESLIPSIASAHRACTKHEPCEVDAEPNIPDPG